MDLNVGETVKSFRNAFGVRIRLMSYPSRNQLISESVNSDETDTETQRDSEFREENVWTEVNRDYLIF